MALSHKQHANVARYKPHSSLREGAGTAVAVTEGASGGCSSGLLLGWYLIEFIDTSTSTAVTIPGTGGAVTIRRRVPCEIGCGHCPPGPYFLAPARKYGKLSGLRGEQLAPARIVPPLRIPRVEPSGIDPSLWLGWWILATTPVMGCGFWGTSFPRCRLKDRKSPVSHHRMTPGAKRLPCQRELAKIFDF